MAGIPPTCDIGYPYLDSLVYRAIEYVQDGFVHRSIILDIPVKIGYTGYMTNQEISQLLDQESYRIWDTTKVIKNQDYHDGLVKGLKMAAQYVAKL